LSAVTDEHANQWFESRDGAADPVRRTEIYRFPMRYCDDLLDGVFTIKVTKANKDI